MLWYTLQEHSCVEGFVCFLGNRPHPSATEPPLPDSDPRRQFALKSCDPRVHFALVCGAVVSGCDPVFLSCKLPSPLDPCTQQLQQ